ncbi:MAG: hypothetical protein ACJ8KU_02495 [Chthoniobacterales bacterium]
MRSICPNRGSTVPAALVLTFVLCVLIAVAVELTSGMGRHTQGAGAVESAISVADGSLDYLYANWRHIARTSPNMAPTTSEFSSIATPDSGYFPDIQNWRLKNFGVVAVDPLLQPLPTASTPPTSQTGRGPGNYSYCYLATADVEMKLISRTMTQKVRRVFQKKVQSPWNFALFYNDVLEIQPSAPLTLTGWVHSNDNLYTGSNKLTLTDRLTTSGTWNIGYAPGDTAHTGAPAAPIYPANEPPAQEDNFQPFGLDPKLLNTADKNANNDSFREIAEMPDNSNPDPLASQRYYNQAGIKVILNGNSVVIRNQANNVVTAASKGNDLAIYNAVNSALRNQTTFQDNREGASISARNIDVGPIASSAMTWNNILYVTDQSATPSNHHALRLTNGNVLPQNGMTFVTDNTLYIQGDWNTGANPPSSATIPDSSKPLDQSYAWRPSAVIADAITLLSNGWQDNNSARGLNQRPAANTTINAALVAGNVPTGSNGSNYSGGAENFVRFLEDWTGKTFTYYGSMLQLYESVYGTGKWGKANVYAPAQLKWFFDDNFTVTGPPGSAVMISYVQQRWFQE